MRKPRLSGGAKVLAKQPSFHEELEEQRSQTDYERRRRQSGMAAAADGGGVDTERRRSSAFKAVDPAAIAQLLGGKGTHVKESSMLIYVHVGGIEQESGCMPSRALAGAAMRVSGVLENQSGGVTAAKIVGAEETEFTTSECTFVDGERGVWNDTFQVRPPTTQGLSAGRGDWQSLWRWGGRPARWVPSSACVARPRVR